MLSTSDQTKATQATPEDEDKPIITLDQEEEGQGLAIEFDQRINLEKPEYNNVVAFGFDVSTFPTMATTTLHTTIAMTVQDQSAGAHRMFSHLGMGGRSY